MPFLSAQQRRYLLLLLFAGMLGGYPIYRTLHYGVGLDAMAQRQIWFMAAASDIYNPWQYRVLCPILVETAARSVEWLQGGTIPIERIYAGVFVVFRWLENIAIFALFAALMRHFVRRKLWIYIGWLYLAFAMGNATEQSDLSLNTYFDVILYLLGAVLMLQKASIWWLVPLTAIGAANRETIALLPLLAFFTEENISLKTKIARYAAPMAIAGALFIGIYIGIRYYYGWFPAEMQPGKTMFWANISHWGNYAEVFGVVSVLPVVAVLAWADASAVLRRWAWLLLPIWLGVHYWSALVCEARLFMVPLCVVLLPLALQYCERVHDHEPQRRHKGE